MIIFLGENDKALSLTPFWFKIGVRGSDRTKLLRGIVIECRRYFAAMARYNTVFFPTPLLCLGRFYHMIVSLAVRINIGYGRDGERLASSLVSETECWRRSG